MHGRVKDEEDMHVGEGVRSEREAVERVTYGEDTTLMRCVGDEGRGEW